MAETNGTGMVVAETRAVAKAAPGFVPTNLDEGMRLAEWLSKSALVPKPLQGRPNDVLVILLKGLELGLKPMQAIGTIHVIEGRASCAAELLAALIKAHPSCEYFSLLAEDADSATYESKCRDNGKVVRMTFTSAQAQAAGLTGKDNWRKWKASMLRARAISALAKAEWQHVTLGLDALEDLEDRTIDVTPDAPPPALPPSKTKALAAHLAAATVPPDVTPAPAASPPKAPPTLAVALDEAFCVKGPQGEWVRITDAPATLLETALAAGKKQQAGKLSAEGRKKVDAKVERIEQELAARLSLLRDPPAGEDEAPMREVGEEG